MKRKRTPYRSLLPTMVILGVIVVLVLGLALSRFIFDFFHHADLERLYQRIDHGLQTRITRASSFGENPSLDSVQSLFTLADEYLQEGGELTPQTLQSWLDGAEASLHQNASLRLMPATVRTNPPPTVNVERLPPEILPPDQRKLEPYFALAAANDQLFYPVTMEAGAVIAPASSLPDFHADPTYRLVMDQAMESGEITSRTSFPTGEERPAYLITHYFRALYDVTAEGKDSNWRRLHHTGFLSLVLTTDVTDTLAFMPESYLGLNMMFFPDVPPGNDAALDQLLDALFPAGTYAHQSFLNAGMPEKIVVAASHPMVDGLMTQTRWWASGISVLLTVIACLLIIWSYLQSRRVMRLVAKRTGELAERTQALSVANDALRRSEARYRMLADNASDLIFTHDLNGMCTYISPSSVHLTGHSPEELIGQPIYELFQGDAHEVIKRGILHTTERVRKDPDCLVSHHPFQFQTRCKDGSAKWVEISVNTLKDDDGVPIGFIGVTRDITGRIEAEEEKTRLEANYRQALKMEAIGNLAGGVAHDFNNLLTGILGHTEILRLDRHIRPDSRHSLDVIETAAVRARALTSQLLGFARKGQYTTELLPVGRLIRDVIALMERTIDKRISLILEEEDPGAAIHCDPGQMSQVFLNLALNARDAMPTGGTLTFSTRTVILDAEFCRAHINLEPGRYCHIAVKDTGTGISPDNIEHVFEPFFTDKENGKGTGMGLAMAYGVIQNHDGLITASSPPGEGSCFDIHLPSAGTVSGDIPAREPQPLSQGQGLVLVIDDEEIIRTLATIMLERLGYDVITAVDGNSGVQIYAREWRSIDLVIIDMVMPDTDGLGCLASLRTINPGVRAILSTGYSRESMADKIRENRVHGFLEKPFRLQDLSITIRAVMSGETPPRTGTL